MVKERKPTIVYQPLLGDKGHVIDLVNTSPMYVSLGIGLQIVNIMENMCVELDGEVKGDSLVYCDRMKDKMKKRQDLCIELAQLHDVGLTDMQCINDIIMYGKEGFGKKKQHQCQHSYKLISCDNVDDSMPDSMQVYKRHETHSRTLVPSFVLPILTSLGGLIFGCIQAVNNYHEVLTPDKQTIAIQYNTQQGGSRII